jgi:chromosome segregation ATPase
MAQSERDAAVTEVASLRASLAETEASLVAVRSWLAHAEREATAAVAEREWAMDDANSLRASVQGRADAQTQLAAAEEMVAVLRAANQAAMARISTLESGKAEAEGDREKALARAAGFEFATERARAILESERDEALGKVAFLERSRTDWEGERALLKAKLSSAVEEKERLVDERDAALAALSLLEIADPDGGDGDGALGAAPWGLDDSLVDRDAALAERGASLEGFALLEEPEGGTGTTSGATMERQLRGRERQRETPHPMQGSGGVKHSRG